MVATDVRKPWALSTWAAEWPWATSTAHGELTAWPGRLGQAKTPPAAMAAAA